MQWELDHVFLACSETAAPLKVLSEFGIVLIDGRVHRGQGTANVCAFFENAYFELLFPYDDDELRSEDVEPLRLKERMRWQETGACPFGVCFRPAAPMTDQDMPPIEWWPYAPAYVPQGSSIPIITPRDSLYEPLVFLSTQMRSTRPAGTTEHRGARRTLTQVIIQHPEAHCPSASVGWFAQESELSLAAGPEYRLQLVWDGGSMGHHREIDPLPLCISW